MKLCGAHHYVDLGLHDKAAEWLADAERMVERHTIPIPASIHTAFIIDHAVLNRDAAAVNRWFERMKQKSAEENKPQHQGVDYWLSHASLLWMQGRIDEAKECLNKAEAQAQLLPAVGAYDFDRSRCEYLQTVLHAPPEKPEVFAQAPQLEAELGSQEQEEWAYPASYEEVSYGRGNYQDATCEPVATEPVHFPWRKAQEYRDPAPAAIEMETTEEPQEEEPYRPPFQWPSSMGRKFGSA
jgi:hypothetical protein